MKNLNGLSPTTGKKKITPLRKERIRGSNCIGSFYGRRNKLKDIIIQQNGRGGTSKGKTIDEGIGTCPVVSKSSNSISQPRPEKRKVGRAWVWERGKIFWGAWFNKRELVGGRWREC